jgi:uncharacterized protein (TIGR02145 family)
LPLIIAAITILSITNLYSQVTVGSDIASTKGALLDLKNRQHDGKLTNALDPDNYTTGLGGGGLLLPRVILEGTHTLKPLLTAEEETDSLKYLLTGLMVYNIATDNSNVQPAFYPSVYTWDGSEWVASHANKVEVLSITIQPKAFSFNESGKADSVPTLTVTTSGGIGNLKYQWYMLSGYNIHVRVGDTLKTANDINQGSQTASYKPVTRTVKTTSGVTTDIAGNCGLFRFYCVIEDEGGQRVESNTVEVAVGCGAKNNLGEWLSFMCFNLGAEHKISIKEQMEREFIFYNDSATGTHYYESVEDAIYGDLFQWGRIADGHQKRTSETLAVASMTTNSIGNGQRCGVNGDISPYQQIKDTSVWKGMFVTGTNWMPNSVNDLWRSGRYRANDPCAHYKSDGTYSDYWNLTDQSTTTPACIDPNTGWRLPSQSEWGEIYKGGLLSGTPQIATANTWRWLDGNRISVRPGFKDSNNTTEYKYSLAGGHRILPDNETVTLFLPAGALRNNSGRFQLVGTNCSYWSSSYTGTAAYLLFAGAYSVFPGNVYNRTYGAAIRCIKNS